MEDEKQDFDQLGKLLALMKYEQPPPRYFNEFSGNVISRIRAERGTNADAFGRLNTEAPWLVRFWMALVEKPSFAWAFGAGVCALLLGGVFFVEKPSSQPGFAGSDQKAEIPALFTGPAVGDAGMNQPILLNSTNSGAVTAPNLFDLIPPGQTMPASYH